MVQHGGHRDVCVTWSFLPLFFQAYSSEAAENGDAATALRVMLGSTLEGAAAALPALFDRTKLRSALLLASLLGRCCELTSILAPVSIQAIGLELGYIDVVQGSAESAGKRNPKMPILSKGARTFVPCSA